MNIYKVGDIIIIKANLDHHLNYDCGVALPMEKYRGLKMTISKVVSTDRYYLKEDKDIWNWSSDCFEPKVTSWRERLK